MGITAVIATLYMWRTKMPDFPFGAKGVRLLLCIRGFAGFFGVYGMYYSLLYLPLADTTVLTFLAPVMACAICAYILKEPFSRLEQLASFVSLLGVVLIARPSTIFSVFDGSHTPPASGTSDFTPPVNATAHVVDAMSYDNVTPEQKASAVILAMIGVLGGAWVITTLRWIGQRAHPLLTVNYFAIYVVVVSFILSLVIPGIGFSVPKNLHDWGYLMFLGVCGFASVCLLPVCFASETNPRSAATRRCRTAVRKIVTGNQHDIYPDAVCPRNGQGGIRA
jgi:drug/metabolite transporter (DMT)-like permease